MHKKISLLGLFYQVLAYINAFWQFNQFLFQKFSHDGCQFRAAALTYVSLLSLVPLMTVTYAMFMAVPAFREFGDSIQSLVFQHFVPSSGQVVQNYLVEFSGQARKLTVLGSALLVVSAYFMLSQIESTFNTIWQVQKPRKGISKFLLYWSVLSLGPFLLVLGFVVTSYLTSLTLLSNVAETIGVKELLLSITPWLLTTIVFALLYLAVPNCRVKLWYALVGAMLTATVFEIAKIGFTQFVAFFPTYELVYGAFAAIPLFLVWVYLSWIIILLGAEFVHALSSFRLNQQKYQGNQQLYFALMLLHLLWGKQQRGLNLTKREVNQLVATFGHDQWLGLVRLLVSRGLIAQTDKGGWLLSRDLGRVTLWDLVKIMPASLQQNQKASSVIKAQSHQLAKKPPSFVDKPWFDIVEDQLDATRKSSQMHLAISLEDLFSSEKPA